VDPGELAAFALQRWGLDPDALSERLTDEQLLICWTHGQRHERRRFDDLMSGIELAVWQGTLRATVKGYAQRRERELAKARRGPSRPPDDWASDLAVMAGMPKYGRVLENGGRSPDGPLSGLRPGELAARIAAERKALVH
jgi:hypothetical protein